MEMKRLLIMKQYSIFRHITLISMKASRDIKLCIICIIFEGSVCCETCFIKSSILCKHFNITVIFKGDRVLLEEVKIIS